MTDANNLWQHVVLPRDKKSIRLFQGFSLRAGLSASVTDMTIRLELVKETGGGCETRECVRPTDVFV